MLNEFFGVIKFDDFISFIDLLFKLPLILTILPLIKTNGIMNGISVMETPQLRLIRHHMNTVPLEPL
jgi:hypothetical protein